MNSKTKVIGLWLLDLVNHDRTAISTIGVAVLLAIADGVKQGHVVWSAVGYAALTALAGVARSALAPATVAPKQ